MRIRQYAFHGLILLICLTVVVGLTTLPRSDTLVQTVATLFPIVNHPNAHDAIGHAALYGALTAAIYWALRWRMRYRGAFLTALLSGLALGAMTEFIQQYSPGRAMLLSDLLANWLGAMTVAMLISFRRSVAEKG